MVNATDTPELETRLKRELMERLEDALPGLIERELADRLQFVVKLSPEAYRALERISDESGHDLDDLLTRAVALLDLVYKYHKEGESFGIAAEGQALGINIDVF